MQNRRAAALQYLESAAKILDHRHGITVDFHDPKAHQLIRKYVSEVPSEELRRCWIEYLVAIGMPRHEIHIDGEVASTKKSSKPEKDLWYRGVRQTKDG